MQKALRLAVLCLSTLAAFVGSSAAQAKTATTNDGVPRSVTELRLPEFQAEAMAVDLPAKDLLLTPDGDLWSLGKTSLWQWQLSTQRLKRWPLHDVKADESRLMRLGTDGSSVFAASRAMLYQMQLKQKRIFRYANRIADKGRVLGFAGTGDDFWLVHGDGLLKFDRYGKTLTPRFSETPILPSDHVLFQPQNKMLWITRGNQLLKVDVATNPASPIVALKVKHQLRDIQVSSSGMVVHTDRTVIRLDRNGKPQQSVPVEAGRKLLKMLITEERHIYLFDDRLLEVFTLKDQSAERYRLPIDHADTTSVLALEGSTLAVVVDGRPRVFQLAAKP